ncbi:MAG: hypothetical protein GXP29_15340 [Planctomycetes bacterium]|nr:hypothetical protein [Planctomycetota bacterium]
MKAVIDLIKRYLFEIICGACAIGGLVMIYMGYNSMSNIEQEMQTAYNVQKNLSTMTNGNNLINKDAVDKAQERIDQILTVDTEVMAMVKRLNEYAPLSDSAFPTANPSQKDVFKKAYRREVGSWLGDLKAGSVPTADDIARMRDRIDEEENTREEYGLDEDADENDLVNKPEVRAAISKARSIYCYADQDAFHQSNVSDRDPDAPMYVNRPPAMEQMWHAQLEVWIQRLIVDGIVAVNESAASQLQEENKLAWVGNLPIKELVSIQATQYYVTDSGTSAGSRNKDHASPVGTSTGVFTGNKSNKLYELIQVTVVLVVDETRIPAILSDLCRDRFLTPLRVSYEAVEANPAMEGKIFGDDPVVRMTIDFETQFFSELYLSLMPDKILEKLKKKRPEAPKTEGA